MIVVVYCIADVMLDRKLIKFTKTVTGFRNIWGSCKNRDVCRRKHLHMWTYIICDRTFRNKRISSGNEIGGGVKKDFRTTFLRAESG